MEIMMMMIEVLRPVSQCFGHPHPPPDRDLVVRLSTVFPAGPTTTVTVCDGQKTQFLFLQSIKSYFLYQWASSSSHKHAAHATWAACICFPKFSPNLSLNTVL